MLTSDQKSKFQGNISRYADQGLKKKLGSNLTSEYISCIPAGEDWRELRITEHLLRLPLLQLYFMKLVTHLMIKRGGRRRAS